MKDLCIKLLAAKAKEAAAKQERLSLEAEILSAFKSTKLEGTETKATDGFKVSVTNKLNRILDYKAYKSIHLPENLAFVALKPHIDLKKMRIIEATNPTLVAQCVTVKPAKPAIKIKEV